MAGVADGAAGRWFSPDFVASQAPVVARMIGRLREQSPQGYADCCEALAHADLRESVKAIGNPLLIIAGRQDPVTTAEDARSLDACVADAPSRNWTPRTCRTSRRPTPSRPA